MQLLQDPNGARRDKTDFTPTQAPRLLLRPNARSRRASQPPWRRFSGNVSEGFTTAVPRTIRRQIAQTTRLQSPQPPKTAPALPRPLLAMARLAAPGKDLAGRQRTAETAGAARSHD